MKRKGFLQEFKLNIVICVAITQISFRFKSALFITHYWDIEIMNRRTRALWNSLTTIIILIASVSLTITVVFIAFNLTSAQRLDHVEPMGPASVSGYNQYTVNLTLSNSGPPVEIEGASLGSLPAQVISLNGNSSLLIPHGVNGITLTPSLNGGPRIQQSSIYVVTLSLSDGEVVKIAAVGVV